MKTGQILRDFGLIIRAGFDLAGRSGPAAAARDGGAGRGGAVLGPSALGLVKNPLEGVGAQLDFTIGISPILFHGGTGIPLSVISRAAIGLGLLVLPGALLTAVMVALAVAPVFGAPFSVAPSERTRT